MNAQYHALHCLVVGPMHDDDKSRVAHVNKALHLDIWPSFAELALICWLLDSWENSWGAGRLKGTSSRMRCFEAPCLG